MALSAALRGAFGNGLLLVVSLVVSVLLAEGAAQFYAYKIAKQGKLFRPDNELGWSLLPNNDLTRENRDGDLYTVITDEHGIRGPSSWPADAERRMLVIGDSFAFGQGVELDKRFDSLVIDQIPGLAAVNLGVMGYGPDQQFIHARKWSDQLREGDILLVLTYSNDFFDISRNHHSGRSKPWFESEGGKLVEHEPDIGLVELARDRSYLFSLLASKLNPDKKEGFRERLKQAGSLYEQILAQEAKTFMERGVEVVLVHHGDHVYEVPFDVDQVFASVCEIVTSCLALDPVTSQYEKSDIFISDGHWNEGGHRVASEEIVKHLQQQHAVSVSTARNE